MLWAGILSPCCLNPKRETYTTFTKVSHLSLTKISLHPYMPTNTVSDIMHKYTIHIMCISGNYISYSSRSENYTFFLLMKNISGMYTCVQLTSPKYTVVKLCNCAWLEIHLKQPRHACKSTSLTLTYIYNNNMS